MVKLALAFVLGLTFMSSANAQQQDTAKSFFTMQPCDIAEKMFTLLNTLRQLASEHIQFANEKKIMKRKKG